MLAIKYKTETMPYLKFLGPTLETKSMATKGTENVHTYED